MPRRLSAASTRSYSGPDRKASEIRMQQQSVQGKIAGCRAAQIEPAPEAVDLLSLISKTAELFERQSASKQRRLLRIVVGEAIWQTGELRTRLREPFAQVQLSNSPNSTENSDLPPDGAEFDNWRRGGDSNSRYPKGTTVFETAAFDHSATSPGLRVRDFIVANETGIAAEGV